MWQFFFPFLLYKLLEKYHSRMMGKAKAVNIPIHKYYSIRPKIPQQQITTNHPTNQATKELLYRQVISIFPSHDS
jgi:hypothetical protein